MKFLSWCGIMKGMTEVTLLAFTSAPCNVLIHIPLPAKAELEIHRSLLVRQSLQPKSLLFVSEPADLLVKLGSF